MRRIFLGSLTLILAFVFFITSTELGLKAGIFAANRWLIQGLHIQHIKGCLYQMHLQNIEYHSDAVDLHIDNIYFNWNPFALLGAKFRINTLLITHPVIKIKPTQSEKSATNYPFFYLKYLQLHHLQVNQLVLSVDNDSTYLIQNIRFDSDDFIHYAFVTDALAGDTKGHVIFNWDDGLDWQLDVLSKSLNLSQANAKLIGLINLDIFVQGKMDKKSLSIIRIKLNHINGELNHYPIQGKGDISYQHKRLLVKSLDVTVANAYLRASGALEKDYHFSWHLNLPDLQSLMPSLHGQFSLKGDVSGEYDNPSVQAVLSAKNISFEKYKLSKLDGALNLSLMGQSNVDFYGGKIDLDGYKLDRIHLNGHAQREDNALISQWKLLIDGRSVLFADINLPKFTHLLDLNQSIVGNIHFPPVLLQTLNFSFPQVSDLRGQLSGNIDLSGYLSKLSYKGELNINQGSLLLPATNTRIDQIALASSFGDDNKIYFNGHLRMGAGSASLNGQFSLKPELSGHVDLQGDRLTVLNSNDYKLQANPTLSLDYSLKEIVVTGTIHIPTANISPTSYVSVVTLPKDVVFIGQPKETSYIPNDLKLNINLTLGKPIVFKYQDLTTEVSGGVTIYSVPNSVLMAKGELVLEKGTYQAYGNILAIQQGRIIFDNSPLTNPHLDIKAAKKVRIIAMSGSDQVAGGLQSSYMGADATNVGVIIKGSAEQPIVKLYSSPAGLSQGDILSYLLFGYPKSELSGGNKGALLSALATLNMPGGGTSGITDKLKNFIGLSDIGVGSTEVFDESQNAVTRQTTVNVGKKLSDKLFINYSLGLFSSLSILSIRYQFTPSFAIQSEASTFETAGDLLYRYERD